MVEAKVDAVHAGVAVHDLFPEIRLPKRMEEDFRPEVLRFVVIVHEL